MREDTRRLDEVLAENKRLRALLDELEEVFHRAPVGLFAMDRNLRFIHVNERLAQMNRRTVSEHVGRRLDELIRPEAAAALEAALRHVLETGEPLLDAEVSDHHPDDSLQERHLLASYYPLRSEQGEPAAIVGSVVDISERKRAEAALRASEARYRMLFDSAPIPIWELDLSRSRAVVAELKASGVVDIAAYLWEHPDEMARVAAEVRLVDVNQETVSVLGVAGKEDVPRDVTAYFPGELRSRLCALVAAIAGGAERIELEVPIAAPAGVAKTLAARLVIPPGYEDSHARVLLSFLDVSERKRAEEERRAMDVRVVEAQKLESLGILAAGVAHHFNNLLTAIVGGTSLALMHVPPESRAAHFLRQVELGAARATELSNQMLAYSGGGRFAVEPVDLSRVVVEMRHLLETGLPGKVGLRVECDPALPAIEADPAQIRQVVMNLVLNGGEAIGEGEGSVIVAARSATLARGSVADAAGHDLPEGRCVELSVTDTGPGMDEETRARIFEPFFTTKLTGRGLGMAAVLGIVRGHGGGVRVESALGKGTTVRVYLPSAAACAPGVPAAAAMPREEQCRGTVLIVDDEDVVRNVAGALLEALGFSVIHACDGIECLALYEANREAIVAVLLDVAMPRMDGAEALRELQRINPDVRVLVTSGYPEAEAARRFAGLGTASFIEKPYRLAHLRAKMEALLGGAA